MTPSRKFLFPRQSFINKKLATIDEVLSKGNLAPNPIRQFIKTLTML